MGVAESSGPGAGSGTGVGEEARRCGNEEYEVCGTVQSVCSKRGLFGVICHRVIFEIAESIVLRRRCA